VEDAEQEEFWALRAGVRPTRGSAGSGIVFGVESSGVAAHDTRVEPEHNVITRVSLSSPVGISCVTFVEPDPRTTGPGLSNSRQSREETIDRGIRPRTFIELRKMPGILNDLDTD
jgi:hypothetical protein